ncbi:GtrA family protein [Candidatus Clostridium radicumherbarum]|uniref:GtrA family protein n=1 Tax=Candidatus Clostridium radicumherbarum TaxID=3381662 RepID=A0ABW8TU81_9CLOT
MGKYIQFIKFGIVGLGNTLITFIVYFLLVKLQVYYVTANVIGYIAGIINSFFWNSSWVFKKSSRSFNLLIKFVIVNLITLGITSMILYIGVDRFNLSKYIAQIISTLIGILINYTLNKLWTFK